MPSALAQSLRSLVNRQSRIRYASSSNSITCSTRRWLPSRFTPARNCNRQPGLAVRTSSARVSLDAAHFAFEQPVRHLVVNDVVNARAAAADFRFLQFDQVPAPEWPPAACAARSGCAARAPDGRSPDKSPALSLFPSSRFKSIPARNSVTSRNFATKAFRRFSGIPCPLPQRAADTP